MEPRSCHPSLALCYHILTAGVCAAMCKKSEETFPGVSPTGSPGSALSCRLFSLGPRHVGVSAAPTCLGPLRVTTRARTAKERWASDSGCTVVPIETPGEKRKDKSEETWLLL